MIEDEDGRCAVELDYDASDFFLSDETPPVPSRLTEEAGLVGVRPEEVAGLDRAAEVNGEAGAEAGESQQSESVLRGEQYGLVQTLYGKAGQYTKHG